MSSRKIHLTKSKTKRISIPSCFKNEFESTIISPEPEFFFCSNPSISGGNVLSLNSELRTIAEKLKRSSVTRTSGSSRGTNSSYMKCSSTMVYSMPIESNDVYNLSDISDFELE